MKSRGTAIALLLLGGGAQFAAAQASAPQQLNQVRKQLSQAAQPAPAQPQTKPAPAPQPAAKPQAASQTQSKPPVAANAAGTTPAKPQLGKPSGTVSTASAPPTKPGPQPPVKVVSAKPGNTELAPKGQPVPAAKPVPPTKTVAVPVTQPKATPAVAEVPVAPAPERVARRDPFDPLVDKTKDTPTASQAPLPAGKPGLVVATLRIDGVVKGTGGMIAIVSNPQSRVYFLREGDRLYDGDVEHITMEGVSFHESGKDAFGKAVEREVTKRLYPTPGEPQ